VSTPAGAPRSTTPGRAGALAGPVGRLDKETAGLLILTNDTRLAAPDRPGARGAQELPRARGGAADEQALRALREGVPLEDGPDAPGRGAPAGRRPRGGAWLEIVLREGKNRQVRRMCAAVGHDVLELVRVRWAAWRWANWPREWRELRADEIARLAGVPSSG